MELPFGSLQTAKRISVYEITKKKKTQARGTQIAKEIDPYNPENPLHPCETSVSVACLGAVMLYLTGGGSVQPMQIAASRAGKTPVISPELDPIPQVFASTTMTRSSFG